MRLILFYLTALLALDSCSYRRDKNGSALLDASAIQPSAAQLDQSSFALVYNTVLAPHCISCHGNSGGVNLESSPSAVAALEKIKAQAIDSRLMPKAPEPGLSILELQILNAWIQTNGREQPVDGSTSPPIPPPAPLSPTYTSIKTHIFDAKCIHCHQAGGKAAKYPFTSLAEMINNPDPVVVSGSVAQSSLNDVLQPNADTPMPPPSSGYSPLSDDEIKVIQNWITGGLAQ